MNISRMWGEKKRKMEKYFIKFKSQKTRNKGNLLLPEGQQKKPVATTIINSEKCNMCSK